MTRPHIDPAPSNTSHLQEDGTVCPPVTPDPPPPAGYRSPLDDAPQLDSPSHWRRDR